MNHAQRFAAALVAIAVVVATGALALLVAAPAVAAAPSNLSSDAWSLGMLGAALATAASSIGAGIAVARVGSAAIGALAEKPELFGRLLILVGLAEGIAIYGLIVSILILNRLT
ncbi:MAG: ATP synthase subunit C [Burkholderiales bacterium]